MQKVNQPNSTQQEAGKVPSVFTYGAAQKVEVIHFKNEPHFVAADVCDILNLENVTKALYVLDDDEKLTLPVVRAGQKRQLNVVNESGLYNLIFQSRKEEAKAFRKWVTKEVLPSIRKTGSYQVADGKVFMGLTPVNLEKKWWYPYTPVLKALGFSTRSGCVQERRKKFPQHFKNIYGTSFITIGFAEYLRKSREAIQLRLDFNIQNRIAV